MSILVDYICGTCGIKDEHWVRQPVAASIDCACGGTAYRRFGAAHLVGAGGRAAARRPVAPPAGGAHSCADHAAVPGSCVLVPTAARVLGARARGDARGVDAEFARQERAIAAGTLDPAAPVTTASPAHAAGVHKGLNP